LYRYARRAKDPSAILIPAVDIRTLGNILFWLTGHSSSTSDYLNNVDDDFTLDSENIAALFAHNPAAITAFNNSLAQCQHRHQQLQKAASAATRSTHEGPRQPKTTLATRPAPAEDEAKASPSPIAVDATDEIKTYEAKASHTASSPVQAPRQNGFIDLLKKELLNTLQPLCKTPTGKQTSNCCRFLCFNRPSNSDYTRAAQYFTAQLRGEAVGEPPQHYYRCLKSESGALYQNICWAIRQWQAHPSLKNASQNTIVQAFKAYDAKRLITVLEETLLTPAAAAMPTTANKAGR
jgi:hypothetical protein